MIPDPNPYLDDPVRAQTSLLPCTNPSSEIKQYYANEKLSSQIDKYLKFAIYRWLIKWLHNNNVYNNSPKIMTISLIIK